MQSDMDRGPVCDSQDERTGSSYARKTLVVGLTGGPATGKSTVARMFADLGARVISADDLVHRLLEPETDIWHEVVNEFGRDILLPDQEIDRSRLGDIIFKDPRRRKLLESIIHPTVIEQLRAEADQFRLTGQGVLILEIPLLIETSTVKLVDKVLVVIAEQETQLDRLQKRYAVSRENAMLRISAQKPLQEKLEFADWVINTDVSLHDTKAQVNNVWCDMQKALALP